MRKLRFLPLFSLLLTSVALACVTSGQKAVSPEQIAKIYKISKRKPAAALINFAQSNLSPSLESQLGNLLLAEKDSRVILSIPAQIQSSSFHPFGDGQSNAKMRLPESWKEKGFPVVGLQTTTSEGKTQRKYLFHEKLKIKDYKESDMGGGWLKVQPAGWEDAFYFSFDTGILEMKQFVEGVPEKYRVFAGNRSAPDPARMGKGSGAARFIEKNLGAGYNIKAWYSDNVHGVFPDAHGAKTALGGVLTWGITNKTYGPFKQLYTCFEARDVRKEKLTGLPSGAGWHQIGDAAETLFNNLETQALPVAVARSHGKFKTAYDLTESITATWLQSDEVFVALQNEFHWYLNPYEAETCTEIWVHNCTPNLTNSWGFNCN